MATLADMQPEHVTVQIKTPYGKVIEVALGTLSYMESEEIGLAVNRPVPPQKIDERGKYVPNFEDIRFQRAWAEMNNEIALRRLARALQKGDSYEELRGMALEDVAKLLRTWDSAMIHTLTNTLAQILSKGETRLESLANNFPAVSAADYESVQGTRVDTK